MVFSSEMDETTRMPKFKWGNEIPHEYIYEYFSKLVHVNSHNNE